MSSIENKDHDWRHKLSLIEREELAIDGLNSLGSYDDREIVVETEQGILIVKGERLNIK